MLHSALPADTSASAFAVLTETLACSLIGEPRSTDVDIAIKVAERSDRRDLPFAYERLSRSHQLATEHG